MAHDGDVYKGNAEQRLNRQINYYIMRYMWQVLRKHNAESTVYDALNIERGRFTRAIDYGTIRCDKKLLDAIEEKTGIDRMYFTGERRFLIPNLSKDDWKELFKLRKIKRTRANDKTAAGDYALKEQRVKTLIKKNYNPNSEENIGLYSFCYYYAYNKKAPKDDTSRQFSSLMAIIKEYDVDRLDQYNDKTLLDLAKALSDEAKLINAMLTCRVARRAVRKNQSK